VVDGRTCGADGLDRFVDGALRRRRARDAPAGVEPEHAGEPAVAGQVEQVADRWARPRPPRPRPPRPRPPRRWPPRCADAVVREVREVRESSGLGPRSSSGLHHPPHGRASPAWCPSSPTRSMTWSPGWEGACCALPGAWTSTDRTARRRRHDAGASRAARGSALADS